jgi:hypothetical protein
MNKPVSDSTYKHSADRSLLTVIALWVEPGVAQGAAGIRMKLGPVMEFLGRNDLALTLSDGTTIHESVIASLSDKFRLERVQCIYKRDKDGEALILKYVCPDQAVDESEIHQELLYLVPELCDEFAESTYDVTLIQVGHSDLETNGRGKVPLFINKESTE